jgi:autotransporter-associated beta strand protein
LTIAVTGSNSYDFGGRIRSTSGTVNIVKDGTGTQQLSGSGGNDYTGTTTVNDGTLALAKTGGATAIGGDLTVNGPGTVTYQGNDQVADTGAVTVNSGGTVDLAGFSDTVSSLTLNGTGSGGAALTNTSTNASTLTSSVTLASASSVGGTGNITIAGPISGSAGLTKTGTDSVILTGSNSYTTTTISAGVLQVGDGGTSGTLGTGSVVDDGQLVVNRSDNYLLNNLISGIGSFKQAGGGVTTLGNSANTYGGATIITSGTLSVYTLANSGVASSIGSGSDIIVDGGTLQYTGTGIVTDRLITIGTAGATFDASGVGAVSFSNPATVGYQGSGTRLVTLTGSNTGDNTFSQIIGDSGGATSLEKTGTGTWLLDGNNSYSGGTSIGAGVLAVGDNNALGTGTVTFNGGAISAAGSYTISNAVNIASGVYGTVSGSGNLTFSGAISGAAGNQGMQITSTGITTYGSSNSYNGGTTISTGATLVAAAAGALENTASIAVNSGTLISAASNAIGTSTATAPGISMNNGTFAVGDSGGAVTDYIGTLTLTANSTISLTNNAYNSTLNFNDINFFNTSITLTITSWQGTAGSSGTGDRIFSTTSLTAQQLSQISWDGGYGVGAMQLFSGEIVPLAVIPEPTTVVGALMLAAFVGYRERRRVRGLLGRLAHR